MQKALHSSEERSSGCPIPVAPIQCSSINASFYFSAIFGMSLCISTIVEYGKWKNNQAVNICEDGDFYEN